jgi:hypothetical protein
MARRVQNFILFRQSYLLRSLSPSQESDLSSCSTPSELSENKAPNYLNAATPLQQQQPIVTSVVTPVTMGGGASSQMRAYQVSIL